MTDTRDDVLIRAQQLLYDDRLSYCDSALLRELVDALIQARAEVAALRAKPMERLK